jgi:hypothetical protein
MKTVTTVLCLLLLNVGFAQQVVDVSKQDVRVGQNLFFVSGGEPFVLAKFVNLVEGTPYFKDEWLKGIIVSENDREYKNIDLKIDLLDNKIHYLDANGKEFIATTSVKEVVLSADSVTNYRFVHSSTFSQSVNTMKDSWYLWLLTGTASLYKIFEKNLSEQKPYGSATFEQHIKTLEKYLILYNNAFLEVKKLKEVPSVLSNKKAELEAFLKTKDDPKASMDDRFIKLIEYYNSLIKEKK